MNRAMKCRYGLVCLAALALLAGAAGRARADLIPAADARGIRQFPAGSPFLLGVLSINGATEDRTVLTFDLGGVAGPVPSATLDLDLQNLDPGGPAGVIDVFAFTGKGTVTPDLFSAGTFLTSFGNNASGLEHVDVAAAVQAAVSAGERFLGFRLSTTTADRFVTGAAVGRADPTLTVTAVPIPEPAALTLLGFGLAGIAGYCWRRRRRTT